MLDISPHIVDHKKMDELKKYLARNSITIEQFADGIGVKRRTVKSWFYGERNPRREQVMRIRSYTGGEITADVLLTRKVYSAPPSPPLGGGAAQR